MFSALRPFLFNLDPETAHDLAIKSLKLNPLPRKMFEVENEEMLKIEIFGKELSVSSIIITKLDGTAKGGALISIANKYEIPISYVGLGEKPEDLSVFSAKSFARSILNLKE